jgi:rubrerythrin
MNALLIAKEMEKDAATFYRGLATRVEASGLRQIFTDLAADRQTRYRLLRNLPPARDAEADPARQFLGAAHKLSQELLTVRDMRLVAGAETDYLRAILALEAKTVDFYTRLWELLREADMQSLLNELISQEMDDYNMVRDTFDFVNAPNEYLASAEFSNLDEFHQFGRDIG